MSYLTLAKHQDALAQERKTFDGKAPQDYIDSIEASLGNDRYTVTITRASDFLHAHTNDLILPYVLKISYKNANTLYEITRDLYVKEKQPAYVKITDITGEAYYEIPKDLNQLNHHKHVIVDMVQELVKYTKREGTE